MEVGHEQRSGEVQAVEFAVLELFLNYIVYKINKFIFA